MQRFGAHQARLDGAGEPQRREQSDHHPERALQHQPQGELLLAQTEADVVEVCDHFRQQAGNVQHQSAPHQNRDGALEAAHDAAAREHVAQQIEENPHQQKRQQQRHEQPQQIDLDPEFDQADAERQRNQRDHRKQDAPQAADAELPRAVGLDAVQAQRPARRPGEREAGEQDRDLPRDPGAVQVDPGLFQQVAKGLFHCSA